ncbi:MAG: hypothetical protein PHY80_03035 [Rickettsiales bacterium]|nr:hypothetical protein [Rickettsiales bacterium]
MNENKKALTDFMVKKNLEAKGEHIAENNDVEDTITDAPRSIKQETGKEDIRAAKALATARMILNFFVVLPILVTIILLIGLILIKFLPSALLFLKKFIFVLLAGKN